MTRLWRQMFPQRARIKLTELRLSVLDGRAGSVLVPAPQKHWVNREETCSVVICVSEMTDRFLARVTFNKRFSHEDTSELIEEWIYMARAGSRRCPSSSESISSSWLLAFNARKLNVPRMEATSRHRKMFFLLLSGREEPQSDRRVGQQSLTETLLRRSRSFTWYLRPSIPVKIDVEVAKQHAVKKESRTSGWHNGEAHE